MLPEEPLLGDESTYGVCQAEAHRLRAAGANCLEVRGVALLRGGARGWRSAPGGLTDGADREGVVWVIFGVWATVGWIVVDGGAPPALVLPLVRHLVFTHNH